MPNSRLHTPLLATLNLIRREWFLSIAAAVATIVLSVVMPAKIMPAAEVLICIFLYRLTIHHSKGAEAPCNKIARIVELALLATATVSATVLAMHNTQFIHRFFSPGTLNSDIPFITPLIFLTAITIFSFIADLKPVRKHHARKCRLHNNYNPSQPYFAKAVHSSYHYLLGRLTLVAVATDIVCWCWYMFFYSNANLNSPDRFFFIALPTATFLWLAFRESPIRKALFLPTGMAIEDALGDRRTMRYPMIVRYLVLHNDALLLDANVDSMRRCCVDTPAIVHFDIRSDISTEDASRQFERLTDCHDFNIKELYHTDAQHSIQTSVRIYLVVVNDDADNTFFASYQWCTLDTIDRFMKMGILSPALAAEIYRIYTISMAYKTYRPTGHRLYPIKNYHPTFRLRDIPNWDIDYNDTRWLTIARRNEDSRLWFLYKHTIPHHDGRLP